MCTQTLFTNYSLCKCPGADLLNPCNKPKHLVPEISEHVTSEGCIYYSTKTVTRFDELGIKVYIIDTEDVTPSPRQYEGEEERCGGVLVVWELVPRKGCCGRCMGEGKRSEEVKGREGGDEMGGRVGDKEVRSTKGSLSKRGDGEVEKTDQEVIAEYSAEIEI